MICRRCPSQNCRRSTTPTTSSSPASAAPASSPSAAFSAWRRIWRAGASACSTWRGCGRKGARGLASGRADLCLGGDIVVAGTRKILAAVKHGATAMVVNTAEFLPGEFTRNADFSLPSERLKRTIAADAGRDKAHFIDATQLTTALFGQSIGTNMFLVGYASQP